MTKLILLALVVSLNSFAQTDDGLTLESKTAPTIVEDGTDLSATPAEEPVEAPDTVDVTENVDAAKGIPAQLPDTTPAELTNNSSGETPEVETTEAATSELTNESKGETQVTEAPEATPDETASPEELASPNPIADEEKRPEENPETEKVADQTPPPSVSTPVITTEAPKDDRFINHRKSHWVSTFAFEGLKYELPFDFDGERKNFKDRDQELYGGRVGFGGQLYLGAGFFTTSMAEVFYVGTFTRSVDVANPVLEDEEAGSVKRTGGLYGVELSQNLGYIFEFRTKNPFMDEWAYLTFEPFVEAGIGVAQAYNSLSYEYDTGSTDPSQVQERYKTKIRDNLTNARVGAGFNLTGRSGFFMTARVSVNRYDITERKIDTYKRQDNGTISNPGTETQKDVKIDPITVITVGGGYKF